MSIPKKIHYVWVGGKPKPKKIKRCIKTWKRLKGYEIVEWNEENFDINAHPYTREAYKAKKWAFVSDYIRAYVIYNYGGIYLDTDVIVLSNLEKFLDTKAFVGFEVPDYPFTAVFGAEKNHPFVKDMLDMYNDVLFSFDKQNQFEKVNTKTVSDILINKYNCKANNEYQELKTGIKVYPDNILCNLSEHSETVHVFTGTWLEIKSGRMRKIQEFIKLHLNSKWKIKIYLTIKRILGK